MQEIGDICDCRRPANTVDTKRVSFMHSRGALCHVKILIFFSAGGGRPPLDPPLHTAIPEKLCIYFHYLMWIVTVFKRL